ncbi:MAG: hypothetical protein LC662_04865 [Rhodothermaceae bacterium]|nr:hypothetical protein [Rhodothermaceae bacterium]
MKSTLQKPEIKVDTIETTGNCQLSLISGDFTPEQATDIVCELIFSKINFHQLRCFSSEIRFGSQDVISRQRIKDLKHTLACFQELSAQAEKSGKTLRIKSTIDIELI